MSHNCVNFYSRPQSTETLVKVLFNCRTCQSTQYVEYWVESGDSLDYRCSTCGDYYKKAWRIPTESVIEEAYEDFCGHCICTEALWQSKPAKPISECCYCLDDKLKGLSVKPVPMDRWKS